MIVTNHKSFLLFSASSDESQTVTKFDWDREKWDRENVAALNPTFLGPAFVMIVNYYFKSGVVLDMSFI